MPSNGMLSEDNQKRAPHMHDLVKKVIRHGDSLIAWVASRDGSDMGAYQEFIDVVQYSAHLVRRVKDHHNHRDDPNSTSLKSDIAASPLTGTCDAFAGVRVFLHGVSENSVKKFSLLRTHAEEYGETLRGNQDGTSEPISEFPSPNCDDIPLDLPLLAAAHKKQGGEAHDIKAIDCVRMHLTASVKFLEAVGITGFIVYGLLTDGPRVSFPAAVMTENGVNALLFV